MYFFLVNYNRTFNVQSSRLVSYEANHLIMSMWRHVLGCDIAMGVLKYIESNSNLSSKRYILVEINASNKDIYLFWLSRVLRLLCSLNCVWASTLNLCLWFKKSWKPSWNSFLSLIMWIFYIVVWNTMNLNYVKMALLNGMFWVFKKLQKT